MGPSPAIAQSGLRTGTGSGWRAGVGQAVVTVSTTPSLWLLGALGFSLRGGLVLLIAPVIALPSPVAVRLLLGDNLISTGLAPAFVALMAVLAAAVAGLALVALLLVAVIEVGAFERMLSAGRKGGVPGPVEQLTPADRRRLVASVFAVQLVALGTLAAAALPLVAAAAEATYGELLRPSQGGGLYERILAQVEGPLLLILSVLLLVEIASAVASRRLLAGAFGRRDRLSVTAALLIGLGRPVVRPLSTVGTALLSWLLTIVLLAPALWAVGLAWQTTRSVLLDPAPLGGAQLGGAALAVVTLCGAWLAGLWAAGVASALRAGLWSAEELR